MGGKNSPGDQKVSRGTKSNDGFEGSEFFGNCIKRERNPEKRFISPPADDKRSCVNGDSGRQNLLRERERTRGRKCFAWFSRQNDGRQVSLIDDRTRKWDSLIELAEEINGGG